MSKPVAPNNWEAMAPPCQCAGMQFSTLNDGIFSFFIIHILVLFSVAGIIGFRRTKLVEGASVMMQALCCAFIKPSKDNNYEAPAKGRIVLEKLNVLSGCNNSSGTRSMGYTRGNKQQEKETAILSKHLKLYIFDAGFAFVAAMCLMPFLATPAYAYVDPSVMTYTIQAIAGVVVALSAVFGVLWRKARRQIMKILGIDENANKIVEPAVARITPEEKPEVDAQALEDELINFEERGKKQNQTSYKLSWKRRLAISALVSFTLTSSICLVGPYQIVASNTGDLLLGLQDIWVTQLIFFLIAFVVVTVVLSLFKGKVFAVIIALLTAIGLGMLIQATAMNAFIPSANGVQVNWDEYTTITCISSVVWFVIFALFLYVCLRHYTVQRIIVPAICIILIAVQAISLVGTVSSLESQDGFVKKLVTQDGLFEVNPNNNVIVFILDHTDSEYFMPLLEEYPERFEAFTGFTYYPDSVGSLIPTSNAVPFLLTGQFPQEGDTYSNYSEEIYERGTFLKDINAQDYSVGIYSDTIGDYYQIAEDTMNIHPLVEQYESDASTTYNTTNTALALCRCTLYRDMPWILKPLFWYHTTEINTIMKSDIQLPDIESSEPYVVDDYGFYQSLRSTQLSATDDAKAGAFRFIHMLGAHDPYTLGEDAEPVSNGQTATRESQTLGDFKILTEYIDQLKELGLYDNATIIITSDHGKWYLTDTYLDQPTSPIMFYKPAQTAEEAAQPLKVSYTPVSHSELNATLIAAMGGDSSRYGMTFEEVEGLPYDRPRRYFMTTAVLTQGREEYIALVEYSIEGNVADLSNWHLTGYTIDAEHIDGLARLWNAGAHETEREHDKGY